VIEENASSFVVDGYCLREVLLREKGRLRLLVVCHRTPLGLGFHIVRSSPDSRIGQKILGQHPSSPSSPSSPSKTRTICYPTCHHENYAASGGLSMSAPLSMLLPVASFSS